MTPISGPNVPKHALMRAEWCRQKADECLRLAQDAIDPEAATNYLAMAEQYLVVAEAEQKLAAQLEKLMPPSTTK